MKMYERTKQKMEQQRKKRIREVYERFGKGDDVTFWFHDYSKQGQCEEVVVLLKKEHNGEYYFVCNMSVTGRLYIMKLVYDHGVKLVKVSSKNFEKNKVVFEEWMTLAKFERKMELRRTFNYHNPGHMVSYVWLGNDRASLELLSKKELDEKFYFMCKNKDKNEICIMKLVYVKGARLMDISCWEYEKNKEIFEKWFDEVV